MEIPSPRGHGVQFPPQTLHLLSTRTLTTHCQSIPQIIPLNSFLFLIFLSLFTGHRCFQWTAIESYCGLQVYFHSGILLFLILPICYYYYYFKLGCAFDCCRGFEEGTDKIQINTDIRTAKVVFFFFLLFRYFIVNLENPTRFLYEF